MLLRPARVTLSLVGYRLVALRAWVILVGLALVRGCWMASLFVVLGLMVQFVLASMWMVLGIGWIMMWMLFALVRTLLMCLV